jgi:hypothetical protein
MEPTSILDYITNIVPGLYLADLIGGIIHLFLDIHEGGIHNILSELSTDFQRHHQTPSDIIHENAYTQLLETSIPIVPLSAVIYNSLHNTSKKYILMQIVAIYGLHFSQLLHQNAHYMNHATPAEKDAFYGRILGFLQSNRIIISPEEHRAHHASPKHDNNFCLINGWANPLLNAIVGIPFIHARLFD